jgi:hypothetical protein
VNGKWKIDLEGGRVGILTLTPFLGKGKDAEVKAFGFGDLTVSRSKWGPVRIALDPDAGMSFDKQ